jgi:hypothetical protein
MRWEDERYVRLYTRDTTNWVIAPWQGRVVLPLVTRKLDRAGMLDLGEDGMEGLAAIVQIPVEIVEAGMAFWLRKRTFELHGSVLVMPNYLDAQECASSDRKRAREHRERAKLSLVGQVTNGDAAITNRDAAVTNGDDSSHAVTARHTPSHGVTPYRAVPCRTVPDQDPPVGPPAAPVTPPPESEKPSGDRRGASRGSRLPVDWEPSPATIERFRVSERVNAKASLERFRNHWLAATKGAAKLDWERTFVNWVLEDIARGRASPASVDTSPREWQPEVVAGALGVEEAKTQVKGLFEVLAKAKQPDELPKGATRAK